jgi:long-subunit acyl-CoA synthetase (AMP-forming)
VLTQEWRCKLDKPPIRSEVVVEMKKLLLDINADLARYERLQMIVIASVPWSIENGCLTPTMKIKRNHIESLIASDVPGWYTQGQPVIWSNV